MTSHREVRQRPYSQAIHDPVKRQKQDGGEEDDLKLARLLQEEELRPTVKQKKSSSSSSICYYIKINEDEIANDYPLPAYYKKSEEETDEYVIFDDPCCLGGADNLPRSMLHDWALYNVDTRLVPLELLPLKPCAEIDVAIYGSGVMTDDDGSGYNFDVGGGDSSSHSPAEIEGGIPVFLSAVKEWMIEFGSSMVSISLRTDIAWYRLGKPSKQYAPWYERVLKTARLAISIITLLKEQTRVGRLSFADVIRRVSDFSKDHPAFISSNQEVVERYVVVHGQIILQQFSEYPDDTIKKCPFVIGLTRKMEERHHTKWLVKKNKYLQRDGKNLNPRAAVRSVVSKKNPMPAAMTRLINIIWTGWFSSYVPEESKEEGINCEVKDEKLVVVVPPPSQTKEVNWVGESVGELPTGEVLYEKAVVHGVEIAVRRAVLVQADERDDFPAIYFVEYMFEKLDGSKMFHGRMMQRGCKTVLGNTANEREVFLTNDCMDFQLEQVQQSITLDIKSMPWGHQHRKANEIANKADKARAEERKKKQLPTEYYCKSLYSPERGAFFALPHGLLGLGSGSCHGCKSREADKDKNENSKLDATMITFIHRGTNYIIDDYVYVRPSYFSAEKREKDVEIFKGGRNIGLKAYVICQLLEFCEDKRRKRGCCANSVQVKVRRFFRPEDISAEKAYTSDIREVYYSEEIHIIPADDIEGKCEIRKKKDLGPCDVPYIFDHVFFCEYLYDPSKGSVKKLPSHVIIRYSPGRSNDDAMSNKKKGNIKKGEIDSEFNQRKEASQRKKPLTTLDIFSGCGGLSEGLHQSGVAFTKWAIEYEGAAGDAFKLNHPESTVFVNNCSVILRAVMDKCGDADNCISPPEAAELAASLNKDDLPLPGQVDFITGGPPCQGFSGMNRFNQSTWSQVQCEMILAFLSYADYYRPRFFLLENVKNLVSHKQGYTFRLTLTSLLEMGYQVRFGILEAGAYGVPQSRNRLFIWAASPEEQLPEWPEPMHVFTATHLKIPLGSKKISQYSAVRSTEGGAPFRSITVRDAIQDLPPVTNDASKTILEYQGEPISWFQKTIRGSMDILSDHIPKKMNELNLIRCQRIPKRPGADWRDLPDEKVELSTGQVVELVPVCLPDNAAKHNQWKGLFGRLDWEGNFPTSTTDPQPMGKVGLVFHPKQDRIVTVRECARAQGFPDSYKFCGNTSQKHRQVGNAVPPPLAYALGRKLKEAVER